MPNSPGFASRLPFAREGMQGLKLVRRFESHPVPKKPAEIASVYGYAAQPPVLDRAL